MLTHLYLRGNIKINLFVALLKVGTKEVTSSFYKDNS